MAQKTLATLGVLVRERRGVNKLRETAKEIDIGVATLMRVENGRIPDLETFGKICKWLGEEPGSFLGFAPREKKDTHQAHFASAHFKVDREPDPETLKVLAKMIRLVALRQKGSLEEAVPE